LGFAIARACAARSLEQAAIQDACVCHGAAGIAHAFHRMARATGDAALALAARTWIDRALGMRGDAPLAGFPRVYGDDGALRVDPDGSLLSGATGVALVLHAAISDVEPAWDRLILADLPIAA
jgi:hypothetical protein